MNMFLAAEIGLFLSGSLYSSQRFFAGSLTTAWRMNT